MSTSSGYKDETVGKLKEGIGETFGSQGLQACGRQQNLEGHTKVEASRNEVGTVENLPKLSKEGVVEEKLERRTDIEHWHNCK